MFPEIYLGDPSGSGQWGWDLQRSSSSKDSFNRGAIQFLALLEAVMSVSILKMMLDQDLPKKNSFCSSWEDPFNRGAIQFLTFLEAAMKTAELKDSNMKLVGLSN